MTHLHKRAHETGRVADGDTLKEAGQNVLLGRFVFPCVSVCAAMFVCTYNRSAVQTGMKGMNENKRGKMCMCAYLCMSLHIT